MKMEMLYERILTHWTIQGDGEKGKGVFYPTLVKQVLI